MPHQRPDTITVRAAAAVDSGSTGADGNRTISGVLATYDTTVNPMGAWYTVRLAKGALEVPEDRSGVKLLEAHDPSRVIGVLTDVEDQGDHVTGTFRVGRTQAAQDAVMQAEDGILDGLSVGYRVVDGQELVEDGRDVFEVTRASLFEVSLVAWPADSSARVSTVTASARGITAMTTPAPAAAPPAPALPVPAAPLTEAQLDQVAAALSSRLPAPAVSPIPVTGVPVITATERVDTRYPAARGRDGKLYTAGDYLSAYHAGVMQGEWGRHNEIRAALADELTSDVPGLLPTAIVGELLGRAVGRRDVWDSLRARDMPMAGAKFDRPRITQHVKVDTQAAQKTQVATQKMTILLDEVAKTTLAGALDVAQQVLDWTSPAFLNEVVNDFVAIYLARTNTKAATDLVAATTAGAQSVTWDGTPGTLNAALAEAAGLVINGVDSEMESVPNTIWMSVDEWVLLAGLTDTTGRPLLPGIGATNASGQISLGGSPEVSGNGFRWIVSKKLPAGTLIMGDATYTESYENGRQFLRAVRPDVLGLDLAYMGYTATYFPYPKVLVAIKPAAGGGTAAATTTAK